MLPAPILVCFAVKEEARAFQSSPARGMIGNLLITGMGSRNAAMAIRRAIKEHRPALVLTCGFAGGLDPRLPAGAVVFEAEGVPELAHRLSAAGAQPAHFHCAERVAVTAQEKKQIRTLTKADAVEMESGVITGVCQEQGIPCATVRVILDPADQDLPLDFNRLLTNDQTIDAFKLGAALLSHPSKLPELIRFQRQVKMAAASLAAALSNTLV